MPATFDSGRAEAGRQLRFGGVTERGGLRDALHLAVVSDRGAGGLIVGQQFERLVVVARRGGDRLVQIGETLRVRGDALAEGVEGHVFAGDRLGHPFHQDVQADAFQRNGGRASAMPP